MSDTNEAVAAAPAEIPMAQPVAEQEPEETHVAQHAGREAAKRRLTTGKLLPRLTRCFNRRSSLPRAKCRTKRKSRSRWFAAGPAEPSSPSNPKFSDANMKIVAFKFDLPKDGTGKEEPMPEPVLTLLRDNKKDENGNDTGLRFENTRKHGKIWMLPNDPEGRALADKLDYHLGELAHKMESAMQARA